MAFEVQGSNAVYGGVDVVVGIRSLKLKKKTFSSKKKLLDSNEDRIQSNSVVTN